MSKNKEHLNVITTKDKIEICKKNSQILFPNKYKIANKDIRDKRYNYDCESVFSLPRIPENERTLNLVKKQIKEYDFYIAN